MKPFQSLFLSLIFWGSKSNQHTVQCHYNAANFIGCLLTHCGLVMPYGGRELGQHWFRQWLVAWRHQAITWTNVDLLPEASFGLRVLSLPASVRLSVSPSVTEFVRAITHQPFKLGSPNLDQRCKRPWLRSLLFCGTIARDLQGQIELQSQNFPHFELVHAITHHQLKLQFPNLEQKCILTLFRSLPTLGLIEIDLQFNS